MSELECENYLLKDWRITSEPNQNIWRIGVSRANLIR